MGGGSFACRSALLVHEADERVCPPMKPTAVALAPVLMLGIGLAACSTPESKVRSRLIEVGVSPPMAGCMAERVVDRLSYAQLRRLGELGRIAGDDVRDMRVGERLDRKIGRDRRSGG